MSHAADAAYGAILRAMDDSMRSLSNEEFDDVMDRLHDFIDCYKDDLHEALAELESRERTDREAAKPFSLN